MHFIWQVQFSIGIVKEEAKLELGKEDFSKFRQVAVIGQKRKSCRKSSCDWSDLWESCKDWRKLQVCTKSVIVE